MPVADRRRTVLPAQVLHYLFFGIRAAERRRRRAGHGGPEWPAFGLDRPDVALTIDDGPHPRWTPPILDLLARHRVRATFFLVGARVGERPDLVRRIVADGHTVGNHSLHHPQPFAALTPAAIAAEIDQTQTAIEDAAGITPTLFRAPGGNWSRTVLRMCRERGLAPIDWTINPSDWRSPGVDHITTALRRCRAGQIMLCHDGGGDRSQTLAALEEVLPALIGRGLTFGTPRGT
jgi:peptidoglycan/xylan/chitin deacetylase (PgdA/CDA1 family)